MADVFISYSRADREFVRSLQQTLEQDQRDVWVDLKDIPPTAEWLNEIFAGIEAANSIVFVLSPNSAASTICRQELDHAVAHSKRLVPVVCRDVDPKAVPEALAARNWVMFRPVDDPDVALQSMRVALDTDLDWVRQHTRLLTRAIEWDAERRDDSFVLRGSDLKDAELWLTRADLARDTQATPLQTQYILASRAAATRGQRTRLAAVSAGLVVTLILAVFAIIQRNDAVDQRNVSTAAEAKAVGEANARATAQAIAEMQRDEADRQTRIATARRLASEADAAVAAHPQRGLLLAIEAVITSTRASEPPVPAAEDALRQALGRAGGRGLSGHELPITSIASSPNGRWLVTGSDGIGATSTQQATGTIRLWDLAARPAVPRLLEGDMLRLRAVAISPDSRWVVTAEAGSDGQARLWDLYASDPSAAPRLLLGHDQGIAATTISGNSRWLLTGDDRGMVRIWDLTSADPAAAPLVLEGLTGRITSLTTSPDGRWVVAADEGGTARLWELTDGRPGLARNLSPGKIGKLSTAIIGRNGHWLLTVSPGRDGGIHLWDLTAPDPTASSHLLQESNGVRVSPDGRWTAALGTKGFLIIWDLAADDPTVPYRALPSQEREIESFAIDRHGRWLVTIDDGWDGRIRLWDLTAAPTSPPRELPGHERTGRMWAVIDPDGRWLATASYSGGARLWDLTAADPTRSPQPLFGHEGAITAVTPSTDGTGFVTGSADGTARVWEIAAGPMAEPRALPVRGETIAMAVSPDSRWLAAVETERRKGEEDAPTIKLWDLRVASAAAVPRFLGDNHQSATTLAFSPDSRWLVADGGVGRLWDLASGGDRPVSPRTQFGGNDGITAVVTPDGRWLATMGARTRFWDLGMTNPATAVRVLSGLPGPITDLTMAAHGRWLATLTEESQTTDRDEAVKLWDLSAADQMIVPLALPAHAGGVSRLEMSPDGRWLVTIARGYGVGGIANLWDLSSADPNDNRRILRSRGEGTLDVLISSDSRWAITRSTDGVPRLWDLWSPDPNAAPRFLRGHEGATTALATSPDSRWLLVGAGGDAHLWDLAAIDSTAPPRTFHSDQMITRAVAISSDGNWLVSGGDKRALLWDLRLDTLVDQACRTAGRNLSGDEWQQFFAGEAYPRTCPTQPIHSSVVRRTIDRAESLVAAGDLQGASRAYAEAASWASEIGGPSLAATVCRYGSFDGFASVVMPSCDHAVETESTRPGRSNRNSRGLARALTGDHQGAADDFAAYVEWAKRDGQQEQTYAELLRWISELEAGRTPFDPATLETLRTRSDELQLPALQGS